MSISHKNQTSNFRMKNVHLGIKAQAIILALLASLFHASWIIGFRSGKGFVSNLSLFWNTIFTILPLVLAAFGMWFAVINRRARSVNSFYYFLAVIAAVSPIIVFIWLALYFKVV
jgi:hypothetical protein